MTVPNIFRLGPAFAGMSEVRFVKHAGKQLPVRPMDLRHLERNAISLESSAADAYFRYIVLARQKDAAAISILQETEREEVRLEVVDMLRSPLDVMGRLFNFFAYIRSNEPQNVQEEVDLALGVLRDVIKGNKNFPILEVIRDIGHMLYPRDPDNQTYFMMNVHAELMGAESVAEILLAGFIGLSLTTIPSGVWLDKLGDQIYRGFKGKPTIQGEVIGQLALRFSPQDSFVVEVMRTWRSSLIDRAITFTHACKAAKLNPSLKQVGDMAREIIGEGSEDLGLFRALVTSPGILSEVAEA
ncbi:MAG: hypothetical protein NT099_01485 [Candidatus Saganbacteria bacterium]|nr:hypothetical protein [Candidatus Saganbacteria bacterium]